MAASSPTPYRVDWAGQARDEVHALAVRASGLGIRQLFAAQLIAIQERLEHRPLDWGEPIRWLPVFGLGMRQGLHERLAVVDAVDGPRRIDYVRSIRPVLNHPLEAG